MKTNSVTLPSWGFHLKDEGHEEFGWFAPLSLHVFNLQVISSSEAACTT
jgi:hypothetical protein